MILILLDEETGRKAILDTNVEEKHIRSKTYAEGICNEIVAGIEDVRAQPIVDYDPIKDHDAKTEYTQAEWEMILTKCVHQYAARMKDANPWQRAKHTWQEWSQAFWHYMSW